VRGRGIRAPLRPAGLSDDLEVSALKQARQAGAKQDVVFSQDHARRAQSLDLTVGGHEALPANGGGIGASRITRRRSFRLAGIR
jgi:hypothetical protein